MQPGQHPEFEMTLDGVKWERVRLPENSLPYHQTLLLGTYNEGTTYYRTSSGRR